MTRRPAKDRMHVWISCDENPDETLGIGMWAGAHPDIDDDGLWQAHDDACAFVDSFCPDLFAEVTGVELKPGECVGPMIFTVRPAARRRGVPNG